MRNVVIGSFFEWACDEVNVGIHAIGKYFITRNCQVKWIVKPTSLFTLAKPQMLKRKLVRLLRSLRGPNKYAFGQSTLVEYVPLALFHPISGIPFFSSVFVAQEYWKYTLTSPLSQMIKSSAKPVDLLVFDCGGVGLFPAYASRAKLTVYRLNDLLAEFPNISQGQIKNETNVLKKSDIVLPVSESLYNYAVRTRGSNEGVYLLPNGVDTELFSASFTEPVEYKHISPPVAVYVGSLSEWFDWNLFIALARRRPDVSFCIIGRSINRPDSCPDNIYFLGVKPHLKVPAYLQHADVGLIPFKNVPRVRRVERPLKFYEYIASGLPVITVPYGGMKAMSPPALLAETEEEFAHAIDIALTYSMQDKQDLRKEAQRYSWENIFSQLDQILRSRGFHYENKTGTCL